MASAICEKCRKNEGDELLDGWWVCSDCWTKDMEAARKSWIAAGGKWIDRSKDELEA